MSSVRGILIFLVLLCGCISGRNESAVIELVFQREQRGLIRFSESPDGMSLSLEQELHRFDIPRSGVVHLQDLDVFGRWHETRAVWHDGESIPVLAPDEQPDSVALRAVGASNGSVLFVLGTGDDFTTALTERLTRISEKAYTSDNTVEVPTGRIPPVISDSDPIYRIVLKHSATDDRMLTITAADEPLKTMLREELAGKLSGEVEPRSGSGRIESPTRVILIFSEAPSKEEEIRFGAGTTILHFNGGVWRTLKGGPGNHSLEIRPKRDGSQTIVYGVTTVTHGKTHQELIRFP